MTDNQLILVIECQSTVMLVGIVMKVVVVVATENGTIDRTLKRKERNILFFITYNFESKQQHQNNHEFVYEEDF